MVTDLVLPDLLERSGERSVIVSRSLKTWGTSESGLAEMIAAPRRRADEPDHRVPRRGIEGLVRAHDGEGADRGRGRRAARRRGAELAQDPRRPRLRGRRRDDGVARCSARARRAAGRSGVAESLTGGLDRRAPRQRPRREPDVPRLDRVVRHRGEALGARRDGRARRERGVRRGRWPRARSACSAPTSGSRRPASPAPTSRTASRSAPCGSALAVPGHETEAVSTRLPGDRERIRQFSTISLLNLLRLRLDVARREPDGARVRRGAPARRRARRRRCDASSAVRDSPDRRALDDRRSSGTSRCSSSGTGSTSTRSPVALGALRVAGGRRAPRRRRGVPDRAAGAGRCGSVPWSRAPRCSTRLAGAVGERLAPLGHEPEDRPFHAHLTLARLGRAVRRARDRRRDRARARWGSGGAVGEVAPLREPHPPRRRRVPRSTPRSRSPAPDEGAPDRFRGRVRAVLDPERVFG